MPSTRSDSRRPRTRKLGELIFCDAVCMNGLAVWELDDDNFKSFARELVGIVRRSATVNWEKEGAVFRYRVSRRGANEA